MVSYSDHKIVTRSLDVDKVERASGCWKFNKSLLSIQEYSDRIKLMVQKSLTCAIINNKW